MSLKPWKRISSEIVQRNPWWEYRKDELIDGKGNVYDWHYLCNNGGVVIVGMNDEGKIPMVRQFRPTLMTFTTEFPAGIIEDGDDIATRAVLEMREEVKYEPKDLIFVGKMASDPGKVNSYGHIFVAKTLVHHPKEGDPTEDIEVLWFTPEEIDEKVKKGEIFDTWSISAWHLAKDHLKG